MTELLEEEELYYYNLKSVAKAFGLLDGSIDPFPTKKAVKLLNYADELSFEISNEERLKSLLICALIWENRHPEWTAIPAFISRILIRLGLGTSAKMVNWNLEFKSFDSLGSMIDELESTVKLMDHEVIINNNSIIFSDFQKRMWDAMNKYSRLGISAPTSAGKSFVLINKAIHTLMSSEGKIVFIVPTISLITQVSNDLRKKLKEYKITDIHVFQTVNDITLIKSKKSIYVLTQERASSALNHPDADFNEIDLLIIDEVQNIEKVPQENEERAKILFDVIEIFKTDLNPKQIIVSGPRLKNISEVVGKWFGESARSVSEELPAVINITYVLRKERQKLSLIQYLTPTSIQSIEVKDKFSIKHKILKRQKYGDEEFSFIADIINKNINDGNIIFSDTTNNANKIALGVAEKLKAHDQVHNKSSITSFIETTVHPKYSLIKTVDKGVAFHHSKMPQHIRNLVEKLFSLRSLTTIVSTTTLMQGINLPAKNIIIRSPKVGDDQLTGYEFSNLKGRAGRLMEDFVGRALIIDEPSCEKASIDLKKEQHKDLNVGYGKRYLEEKDKIDSHLTRHVSLVAEEPNDIVTYIRNMAIKYQEGALQRVRGVGIELSEEIFIETLMQIRALEVPKEVCLANFYWDPYTLNKLYLKFIKKEIGRLPNTIIGSTDDLYFLLLQMHEIAPYYYNRYIPSLVPNEHSVRKIKSLCIYAEQYGVGKPLSDVINPVNFPVQNSEDIDERINDLQSTVVYGIPKLLKPLFQINDIVNSKSSSHVLGFIEVGAMDARLRALIEIGIPRETAIYMLQNVTHDNLLDKDGRINIDVLNGFIIKCKKDARLNEWHRLLIMDL